MFSQEVITLAVSGLATLSVVGIIISIFYPYLVESGQDERIDQYKTAGSSAMRAERAQTNKKRKEIQDKLKQHQESALKKASNASSTKADLLTRLKRAGLDWTKEKYFIVSAIVGVGVTFMLFTMKVPIYLIITAGIASTIALPHWYVSSLIKKRQKKFLEEFPNALDVIVRGMKAGMPVGECFGIISREAEEPVRSEFKTLIESQKIGLTLTEAVTKLYERVPMPETNFFALMIGIQAQAGGNLSEALGNLSSVVRDRRKMSAKIQAMSMEAKAGACIIGSLPVVVLILVYLTTPEYISLLFTEQLGNMMLGMCAFWMLLGVLVMRKMINFDF